MDRTKRILIAVNVPADMADETATNIARHTFGEASNPRVVQIAAQDPATV